MPQHLITDPETFDRDFFEPVVAYVHATREAGKRAFLSFDAETTRIDKKRGFNPFYGSRVCMGSFSFDGLGGEQHDFAFTCRMKRALRSKPERPSGKGSGDKKKEFNAAWKKFAGVNETPGTWDPQDLPEWLELDIEEPTNFDIEHVIKRMNELTDLGVVWIGKNVKFDLLMYNADGFVIPPAEQIEDVEPLSHLSEEKPWQQGKPVSHSLQPLAERHLGRPPEASNGMERWFDDEMGVKKDLRDYSAVPVSIEAPYAMQDTRDTLDLFFFFIEKIHRQDKESRPGATVYGLYRQEIAFLRELIIETILPGCPVSQEKADEAFAEYQEVRRKHAEQLYELTGKHLDWDNPHEVAPYLFDPKSEGGLGLQVPEHGFTATGQRSTSDKVLQRIDHPVVDEILAWRKANTFIQSFLEPIARFNYDGFIHPDFWLTSTRTGRMSCTHPNMQNRPKDTKIREIFRPRDGYVFLLMDYDQIEMRIAAHYAKKVMDALPEFWVQLFFRGRPWKWIKSTCTHAPLWEGFVSRDPSFDPHMRTAEHSGLPRKTQEVGKPTAKTLNFLIIFGGGLKAQEKQLGFERAKAKKMLQTFREANPEIEHLKNFVTKRVQEKGWVSNEFGRRYYIDRPHLGLSYIVQGCAGDLIKRGVQQIYEVQKQLREEHEGPNPLYVDNIVHDEVIMEVREDLLSPQLAGRVNSALTTHERDGEPIFSVPITAGCEVAPVDWGHPEEYEVEIPA